MKDPPKLNAKEGQKVQRSLSKLRRIDKNPLAFAIRLWRTGKPSRSEDQDF